MTPVYFPYTTPSDAVLAAAGALGRPVVVLAPSSAVVTAEMNQWAQKGRVALRTPPTPVDRQLRALLQDYRAWAGLHAGRRFAQTVLLAQQTGGEPPPADRFVSQLKTDIQRMAREPQPQNHRTPEVDLLLSARLFLGFAHDLDVQQNQLAADLDDSTRLEQRLWQNLHGDPGDASDNIAPPPPIPLSDPSDQMVAERLRAWARVFLADGADLCHDSTPLFVTDRRAVVEFLQETLGDVETFERIDRVPADTADAGRLSDWQPAMERYLQGAARGGSAAAAGLASPPARSGGAGFLAATIYRVPRPPGAVMRQLAGVVRPPDAERADPHTLIGLIESDEPAKRSADRP